MIFKMKRSKLLLTSSVIFILFTLYVKYSSARSYKVKNVNNIQFELMLRARSVVDIFFYREIGNPPFVDRRRKRGDFWTPICRIW